MGLLIVAGFAFIGYEVFKRATDPTHPRAFVRKTPEPTQASSPQISSTLPAGSRIGQMLVLGTRVVYHVTHPDGSEQIHVLDPRAGTVEVPVTVPTADSVAQPVPGQP